MSPTFAGQTGRYYYTAGAFTEAEIERTDTVFSALVNRTQNTKLLKNSDGSGLSFERQGICFYKEGGTFNAGAWNAGGTIHLIDGSFTSGDPALQGFLLHEIGHNWDSQGENGTADQFRRLSGWTTTTPIPWGQPGNNGILYSTGYDTGVKWYYNGNAGMVSDYARTNPEEDFAESFATYFGFRGSAAAAPLKMAYMDSFMNWAAVG